VETDERILAGALRALARFGPRRLSLGDVCREAQVSRATLFRYYPTKDELLGATARHIERDFRATLIAAAERSSEADRLGAVIGAMLDFVELRPATTQLLSVEPGFVLEFLTQERVNLTRIVRDEVPAVRNGDMSEAELAELLIHVANAAFLIPSTRLERLSDLLVCLLGVENRSDATAVAASESA
jgi:AcrR family transcriptional regulator